MNKIVNIIKSVFKDRKKIIILLIIIGLVGFASWKIFGTKQIKPQYQTASAEKNTLTIIVSASGQVSQANSATVDTQASGVISKIYVQNGQKVQTGDIIAEIDLDLVGKQRATQALASYQSAKNSLESAKTSYFSYQSAAFKANQKFMTDAVANQLSGSDPTYISENDDWLKAEADFKNQTNSVVQAQTNLTSAWLSYQRTSSTIYAPISGTVTGLSLQIGTVLVSQSNTSGTATAQKIASIQTGAPPIITVNLSQIDTPSVKIGNAATLTFDAFPGKTFTGKIVSIDTIGSVSSGVTTYPAVIKLDTEVPEIFSNMTAQANIITQIKDNVLLVPNSAVKSQNGQSYVQVLRDNQVEQVNIETGLASGSETEIISGLQEGDIVITNTITTINQTGQSRNGQNSPFGGGFGSGGAIRINR